MALFELDEGRLIPAQFGQEVSGGFTPDVLNSVRAQVLEIISRPLFPITWRDVLRSNDPQAEPRLTALDASGQVVAIEVMEHLDSETLIDSLSRLADTSAMSWADLANEYPGGIEAFQRAWVQFREAMPSSPPNGPRLIIVAGEISPDVRPALDVLSSSGVEVHEMALRRMNTGRSFLDITVVGPRMYGHRANLLLGDAAAQGFLEENMSRHQVTDRPQPSEPGTDVLAKRSGPPTGANKRVNGRFPSRAERRRSHTHGHVTSDTGPWPRSPQALKALGQAVGQPVSLVCMVGVPLGGELSPQGVITVAAGSFVDPTEALLAEGITGLDGWVSWHIGDQYGPTLAEALTELNSQFSR